MPNPNVGLADVTVVSNPCTMSHSNLCVPGGSWVPYGQYQTTYTCPDNYTLNAPAYTTCTPKTASATGSDSGGSYTITYSSCAPKVETDECGEPCSMMPLYECVAC
ncbi:hypothetical protein HDR63_00810 [bacterium]|nr:hypothetical protein [bacterium]